MGLLAAHPAWGVVALPLLARMYVRKKDLPRIDPRHRPEFRTKLDLAVELLRWAKPRLGLLGKPLWVVADGAYAEKEFLKPAIALGMTVVSRLRCDASSWSLPPEIPPGQRGPGRPRVYGTERISLTRRAGQRRGWTTEGFSLYGGRVTKRLSGKGSCCSRKSLLKDGLRHSNVRLTQPLNFRHFRPSTPSSRTATHLFFSTIFYWTPPPGRHSNGLRICRIWRVPLGPNSGVVIAVASPISQGILRA